MKITYGVTCLKNEDTTTFFNNVKLIKKLFPKSNFILNTDIKLKDEEVNVIYQTGDMKTSRQNLMLEAHKYDSDMYFIFDSDIKITKDTLELIKNYNFKNYDFVSLYYKGDPPIPAFYTLSSSLTDFYNRKTFNNASKKYFFDDTNMNDPAFHIPSKIKYDNNINVVLSGKSYARKIDEFTNEVDEEDTTTGGASIYFNKETLLEEFPWEKYKGKSLTWYDSYRTYMMTKKGYKFAKVPIFVEHKRHNSIQLSWISVERYILGFNKYMKAKNKNWNDDALWLHSYELFHYINGMIKKIEMLKNLKENEQKIIIKIKKFLKEENFLEERKKWK